MTLKEAGVPSDTTEIIMEVEFIPGAFDGRFASCTQMSAGDREEEARRANSLVQNKKNKTNTLSVLLHRRLQVSVSPPRLEEFQPLQNQTFSPLFEVSKNDASMAAKAPLHSHIWMTNKKPLRVLLLIWKGALHDVMKGQCGAVVFFFNIFDDKTKEQLQCSNQPTIGPILTLIFHPNNTKKMRNN